MNGNWHSYGLRGLAIFALTVFVVTFAATITLAQKAGPEAIYPDATKTPGATNPDMKQSNIQNNICKKGWSTASVRPPVSVTNKIKKQTMTAYGFTDAANHYELDHLISLQNGGCPDCVENLWPEAYGDAKHPKTQNTRAAWDKAHPNSTTVLPGALQKDKVEGYVHDAICLDIPNAKFTNAKNKRPPDSVTLQRGQEILADDWYMCYLKMTHHMACQ
jgi:hypothetical protein